jgi:hypothetical protein
MSRLEYYHRPLVAFDPTNKEHRRWFAMFQQRRTWGHCPVRFICPDGSGMDVPGVIMRQLMDYYVGKEFRPEQLDKAKGPAANSETRTKRIRKG